ncbi:protein SIEVE ELEMENT OCCLUSION B-like [Vicia villosa]|uniref:protein SIEVE ELEMENT OCCLUSION B-like n=1 Tax=Vicia villosa TaxID=3911 RepID=UPI00273C75F3|nr:protein SIEVE ELEMENT OCCLUSION B-like [Vicia villosa]
MTVINYKKPLVVARNPSTMPENDILEVICSTHVYSDTKFDAESLFKIARNILTCSTNVVDNVVHGNQASEEQFFDNNIMTPASFKSPLCILKKINSEMACKGPGAEIAYETTLAILSKLSNYSWISKAVLTLSAFSIEYGEFWLSQYLPAQPLAKSLGIIKLVPQLTKPESLKKHITAISELNNLVKKTLKLVDIMLELKRLNSCHDIREVPALAPALEQIPVGVFWVINTIVAIVTQIECLTTDSEKRSDLSHSGQAINIIINNLEKHLFHCDIQIREAEYNKLLNRLFQIPTEITEVLKVLFFWKFIPKGPIIYDGSEEKLVEIDVLKKKDVLLLITTLEINQEDISMLILIHEYIKKKGNQHVILWVPIVEKWDDKLIEKFDYWKSKMPWYVLHHFQPITGIKYIRKELHFKQKPLVVVLSPQGKILHQNAYHMIQVWGIRGFPFSKCKQDTMKPTSVWDFVDTLVVDITIDIKWEEEKSVIIYGGKNTKWTEKISEYETTIKETNTSIEVFSLESQEKTMVTKFWKKVESLVVIKMHEEPSDVKLQVEKLLSYKNETGWAVVIKGNNVSVVGHETTISKTIDEIKTWRDSAVNDGFNTAFTKYHQEVAVAATKEYICSNLEIYNFGRKNPDTIRCPHCDEIMEMVITYKCSRDKNLPIDEV